jgi:endonuclease III
MKKKQLSISQLFAVMDQEVQQYPQTMTAQIIQDYGKDPYLILISCLLSLRARDVVTYPVSKNLFEYAQTPE